MKKEDVKNKEDFIHLILVKLYKRVHEVKLGDIFFEIMPSGGIDSFKNLLDELHVDGLITKSANRKDSVPGFPGLTAVDLRYSISLKGIKYLKNHGLINSDFMTAYEILERETLGDSIKEKDFYQLIKDFQSAYLRSKKYEERLGLHRNPIELKNEILNELYSYIQQIQRREEMIDFDLEKNSTGYVPTKIMDVWRADKRLKSLYNAVKEYCKIRSKNFSVIGIHIAEYRAMNNLVRKIKRSIYRSEEIKQTLPLKKDKEIRKPRIRIPNKIKAELQKEIESICPFCDNSDVGHFEIHHIDEIPSNNDSMNLILLCPTCHSKITKDDISKTEVMNKKHELLNKQVNLKGTAGRVVNFNSNIANAVVGDNNEVKIITQTKKSVKQKYPPGCVGFDSIKANYVSHLINRYNEYKKYEVGKGNMNYAVFLSHLKKKFKIGSTRTIYNLPIEKFDELVQYIQLRIDSTKLAKVNGRNNKNYSSFDEYKVK